MVTLKWLPGYFFLHLYFRVLSHFEFLPNLDLDLDLNFPFFRHFSPSLLFQAALLAAFSSQTRHLQSRRRIRQSLLHKLRLHRCYPARKLRNSRLRKDPLLRFALLLSVFELLLI